MSDYRDILLKALKEGKTMDSCGLDERYYDFGLYTDLCGMSVEDAIKSVTQCCCGGGGSNTGSTKTNNPIIITAEENGEGKYAVKVKAAYATTAPVIVTFTIDGQNVTATIPAGASETTVDGVVLDTQYATIGKIDVTSTDEVYKYTVSANIADGLFVLTYKIDGKTVHELKIKVGTKIEKFEPEAKTGYLFKGWVPAEPETMPDKDTTLEGTYEAIPYYIVFKDETTGDIRVECFYQGEIKKPNASEKKGHDFQGWFMADGNEVPDVLDFIPDGDVEATPKYEPKTYTLTYQTYDGQEWKTASIKYDTVIAYETDGPARVGYDFTGWDNKPENDRMPDSDVILKALYEIHKWSLIYSLADDENPDFTGVTFENVEYNAEITEKTTTFAEEHKTDEGKYVFSWDGTEHETTNMPDSNLTIKAIRKVVEHTLTFMSDGAEYKKLTGKFNTPVEKFDNPTKTGYEFTRWDEEVPEKFPNTDKTFTAQFTIKQYTVTINDEEGTHLKTVSVDYNTEIATIESPVKEGYTFVEYTSAEGYTNVPDKDITIVAKYQINVHKVTYFVDDVKVHEQEYSYHATIAEYNYTKEGYTISAWVGLPVDMLMPDEDLEIRATSVVNEYDVIFNVDGTEYDTKKVAYGAAITVPTVEPTKTGYTFKQWVGIPETMPAHNVTIEAKFTINSYTLTFKNGVDVVKTFTVEYGAALADYASQAMALVPEKEGFTFSWDSAVPTTMPAEDVVIEGSYKEKQNAAPYYGTIAKTALTTLNEDIILNSGTFHEAVSGEDAPMVIPKDTTGEYLKALEYYDNNNSKKLLNAFGKSHIYSIIVAMPASITNYTIKTTGGFDDATEDFVKNSTMTINGTEYNILVFDSKGDDIKYPYPYSSKEKDVEYIHTITF